MFAVVASNAEATTQTHGLLIIWGCEVWEGYSRYFQEYFYLFFKSIL
jgi:hypothetical protein